MENLVSLIRCAIGHPAAAGGAFHASDAADLSTPELIEAVASGLGLRARLFQVPESVVRRALQASAGGAVAQQICGSLRVDSSGTRDVLGWLPRGDPRSSIMESVRETTA